MESVRLADLLAGLSRQADLGFGLPIGTALRSCALATRLADAAGLPADDARAAFYTALLHHVGCTGYAHETAQLFGDELAANTAAARTDTASGRDVVTTFLPLLTGGRPARQRVRLAYRAVVHGDSWGDAFTTAACELARDAARRLHLPETVQISLFHVFDSWRARGANDGGGRRAAGGPGPVDRPGGLSGWAVPVGARVARLTGVAVLFDTVGGVDGAVTAVRRRAGRMLDPELAERFQRGAARWLPELATTDPRRLVLDAEPGPVVTVPDPRPVAELFGDLADVATPYFLGHARAVAWLAGAAAQRLGLPADTVADLRVAGHLHDVGRVGVSASTWEKPGLDLDEWEQVRLHPYYSERVLAGSQTLARLGGLVGRHHERLDGSGYHRGCTAAELAMPARVLAAADAYRTLLEPRPHRAAWNREAAGRRVSDEARRRTLDPDAVWAVLAAAGHGGAVRPAPGTAQPPPAPSGAPPPPAPGGLSDREVEVLRLLALGCGNAEIATRLVISRRTAEHHVQHVYAKIDVSSRAAATLFAVRHRLVE
ncbi:HD domain-containing phosphohydrolase [Jiangella asiatica]|uniref:HD domain-containing protein n=1 Tax=Jiangella asiatica TaxID=2530372 RepID=A0A4R5CGM0_9ACTN|nr:HD domain-containing phosphohydrolase [Jiangella asiatica]TDD98209.1 HD domain-containing protein [Jiangella asiatica]